MSPVALLVGQVVSTPIVVVLVVAVVVVDVVVVDVAVVAAIVPKVHRKVFSISDFKIEIIANTFIINDCYWYHDRHRYYSNYKKRNSDGDY